MRCWIFNASSDHALQGRPLSKFSTGVVASSSSNIISIEVLSHCQYINWQVSVPPCERTIQRCFFLFFYLLSRFAKMHRCGFLVVVFYFHFVLQFKVPWQHSTCQMHSSHIRLKHIPKVVFCFCRCCWCFGGTSIWHCKGGWRLVFFVLFFSLLSSLAFSRNVDL